MLRVMTDYLVVRVVERDLACLVFLARESYARHPTLIYIYQGTYHIAYNSRQQNVDTITDEQLAEGDMGDMMANVMLLVFAYWVGDVFFFVIRSVQSPTQ